MNGSSTVIRRAAVALLCCVSLGFAARKDEVTLVVVPREDHVVKLGMDIASRYPTLLVSYQVGANGSLSLHGWTGSQWVNISKDDFTGGNFFRTGPDSALLVEQVGKPFPQGIVPPEAWCESVYKISTTDLRPMLHLTGRYFSFPFKEWEWFANRYGFDVDSINPEGVNVAWYNKRLEDHLRQSKAIGADDLQYWVVIRRPEPPVTAVSAVDTNAPAVPAEQPASEPAADPFGGDAPEAVVLGAADAEAAAAPATEKQ